MKKVLIIVFLAAVFSVMISASSHAAITALINQSTYNGHTYGITNAVSSWTDAEAFALTQGGNLATINDSAENAFLFSQYVQPIPGGATTDYWIGLTCPTNLNFTVASNWGWVSGDTSSYRNWRGGQPDTGTGNDFYGVIGYVGTGEWDNFPNSAFGTLAAIVEIAPSSIPEPATMLLLGLGLVGAVGLRRKLSN